MSRDIVDTSTPSDRLVVATRIEGEPANQLACVEVEDPDVPIGNEELDRLAFVGPAEADVMELAVVAQGDGAAGVDLVVADAEVGIAIGRGARPGLDPSAIGLHGRAPAQRPVGPGRVVVAGEAVQLLLQADERPRGGLPGQVAQGREFLAAIPSRSSSICKSTLPPRGVAVKTAPLSQSRLAGVPCMAIALRKTSTTLAALTVG